MNNNNVDLRKLDNEAQKELSEIFSKIEEISYYNTQKVIEAFNEFRISEAMLTGTTGYGYDDVGRIALDKVYAKVFGSESALCRLQIVNGTHAIAIGLYGLLRPGDVMLSISGKPYDTLNEVIGVGNNDNNGSLSDFGVIYDEIELLNGYINEEKLISKIKEHGKKLKVIFIQRSKGYGIRPTFSSEYIGKIAKICHENLDAYVVVDNCYGEFADKTEPVQEGADLQIGSLIKNPGGGFAKTGGYLAGTKRAIELASYRLTTVGIGDECGATLNENRDMFRGFFMAPHAVAQAKKTMVYASYMFEKAGFEVDPLWNEERHDIIQTIKLYKPENLIAICQGIQRYSPIDSYVKPVPSGMPGYDDQVIMAAGTFISGSSLELSCDGPMRDPYMAYLQGGLTYESGRFAVYKALEKILGEQL